ncbi:MAG: lipid-A-disaccharide synthase [Gammaproteobacteria bacterium]|nr:lipid-A-disaccharide synthase [Gammaproteobacteria bacterium]
MRVGIVAGESSGDRLGAGLIEALRQRVPNLQVEGVAGPAMAAAGCRVLARAEQLAVMGIVEVLAHLRSLLALRRRLAGHFTADPPDVFIGVDAPDFNLGLETRLRRAGVHTVHYVSPTVWAWREGRTETIRRAADLVLTLFPFEQTYYRERGIAAEFVGHPLADRSPAYTDRRAARSALGLAPDTPTLALLPGSRAAELSQHLEVFLDTADWCAGRLDALQCAVPVVDARAQAQVCATLARRRAGPRVEVFHQRAQEVIGAADAVLTASGTATIETMLVNRPMVVAYRMAWLSFLVIRGLVRIPWCSMVNVLAGRMLVPEFLQGAMRAEGMGAVLLPWLRDPASAAGLESAFADLGASLRRGSADACAAAAVCALVEGTGR